MTSLKQKKFLLSNRKTFIFQKVKNKSRKWKKIYKTHMSRIYFLKILKICNKSFIIQFLKWVRLEKW